MSTIYENIKTEYQNMQRKSASDLEQRRKQVFSKHNDIEQLDNKLIKLCLQDFKAAISSEDTSEKRKEISEKILEVNEEIQDLLEQKGYARNHLELWYSCNKCKDTGNVDAKTRCECYNSLLFKQRVSDSGLGNNHASFEIFDENIFPNNVINNGKSQRQLMSIIKKRCEEYCNIVPSSDRNLIIMGITGSGKTFLIQCIVDRVLKLGHMAKYYTATGIFNLFFKHRMGEQVDLDLLYEIPLLAIDDLGTEIMTKNVTIEYLYCLISERNLKKLPTIISTNLSFDNIKQKYGDRIHSRLFKEGTVKLIISSEYKDIR